MNTTLDVIYCGDDEKYEDCTFEVEFDFSAYYTPARINCRVEDSCPEDGDSSFEIQKVLLEDKEVELTDLPKDVQDSINQEVSEWVDENGLREIEEDNEERRGEAQYDAQEDAADFYADRGW
jgi:hypothetical protein